jgi:TonB-dependent SusC/RagA subfamily outer membrane receptor
MSSLVYYLLQVIVSSGILYLYYQAFLRNKRFHQYNRFFLLGTVVMSILIPFLHIPVYFTHEETNTSIVVRTLTVLSPSQEAFPENTGHLDQLANSGVTSIDLVYFFYALIAGLALVRIIAGLLRIKRLSSKHPVEKLGNIRFVNTRDPRAPFSFFNWLFWHGDIEVKSEKGEQVFRHELFHIRQRHSLDIVSLEVLTMIFWINPFFHLIKKEIRAIHEFLADQYALDKGEQSNYAETLLMHALQTRQSLVNPFFHNQIKRRIAMITNPQKTSHQYLRKMLVLPVAAVVVTLFAFSYRKGSHDPVLRKTEKPITVIIDAGHGGIDPGVWSPGNLHNESEITLSMAKIIQRLAPEYNINVVLTRESNQLPGGATNKDDGLRNRVEIANAINPKLFISLHVNSGGGDDFQEKFSGIEAYVTNKRQDDPGKTAASAILQELGLVYKTATDLKFRGSLGVFVLDKNKCGTVLLECGYINNQKDLEFITNKDNQEKLARSILKGIVVYNKGLAAKLNTLTTTPIKGESDTTPVKSIIINKKIQPAKSPEITTYTGIDIKLENFGLTAKNIILHVPEAVSKKFDNPELFDLNGELLTIAEAKMRLNNRTINSAEVTLIEENNKDAIKKYGDRAKNGVIVVKEGIVIEKRIARSIGIITIPAPGSKEKSSEQLTVAGEDTDPLLIVDGQELPPTAANKEARKRLDYLDPNIIERIDVLKDQSATDLYGDKGKNGVILIKTKKKSGIQIDANRKDSAVLIVTGYGQKPQTSINSNTQ